MRVRARLDRLAQQAEADTPRASGPRAEEDNNRRLQLYADLLHRIGALAGEPGCAAALAEWERAPSGNRQAREAAAARYWSVVGDWLLRNQYGAIVRTLACYPTDDLTKLGLEDLEAFRLAVQRQRGTTCP